MEETMKRSPAFILFVGLLMALAIGASAETPAAPAPGGVLLKVHVPGKPESTYTLARLQGFPKRTVKARGHGGEEHSYTGVALGDLLRDAGLPGGKDLHGHSLQNFALVTAKDGYAVVFALPELDPSYTDKTVLLVWARDGKPLADDTGPLQVVVPDDKHPARWVRQVRAVDVHSANGSGGPSPLPPS